MKKKEEDKERRDREIEGKRGRGKLTLALRSIRRTLEVKVLHHVPEYLIVFNINSIAP